VGVAANSRFTLAVIASEAKQSIVQQARKLDASLRSQ
jgi:hypothetical protein